MVQVRQKPAMSDGAINISAWLDQVFSRVQGSESDRQALQKACELAQQVELAQHHIGMASAKSWGSVDSFQAGLEMAQMLAELHLDIDALQAAVLYRAVREEKLALSQVEKEFGSRISRLIEGVLRMAAIGSLRKVSEHAVMGQSSAEQIDHVRKMLVALIDDVRVALIKIAERTCAIRAVKNAPEEKRRRVAREVKDIYAPLAHRLGIGQIRWELEDLAFRYLEPQAYQQIAGLLDEKRLQREKYLDEVIELLQAELDKSQVVAKIKGRVKHIYSIWRKMREKEIPFSQVYDVRAVRVLVSTVHECYMVLGIVHGLWRAIPHEFDDYIANPKENGYRSLHTAVIGPQGKVMEVQIRTYQMHEEAEFGVCAHWQYKTEHEKGEGKRHQAVDYEQKVEWLRQVLEWHEETGGDRHLIEELRSDVVLEKIYVFTPDGDVVEMQQGATALDFAYHVHTGLGHRCRGARVNGKVVPLHQLLKNSDQVEIIAGKHEVPNREWLAAGLDYVRTTRSRSKIHQWFRQQDREQHISNGSILLDQEFKRLALSDMDRTQLAQQLKFTDVESLHAAIGAGDMDMLAVLQAVQRMEGVQPVSLQLSFMPTSRTASAQPIIGVGNMAVEMASCCAPDSRHAISGQIIAPQQVRIHRQDCEQLLSEKPEGVIRVSWGEARPYTIEAELELHAYERTGLLRDITERLDHEGANILKLNCVANKHSNQVVTTLTLEIANLQKLSVLLSRLSQIPNIFSVYRR